MCAEPFSFKIIEKPEALLDAPSNQQQHKETEHEPKSSVLRTLNVPNSP